MPDADPVLLSLLERDGDGRLLRADGGKVEVAGLGDAAGGPRIRIRTVDDDLPECACDGRGDVHAGAVRASSPGGGTVIADRSWRAPKQGPQRQLADDAFTLRPDVTITDGDHVVALVDAKWKQLRADDANAGVSSGDAYQMTAYAGRYGCQRLALVYPASRDLVPGVVRTFALRTQGRPKLIVCAVDVADLAFQPSVPVGRTDLLRLLRAREPA